MSGFSCRDKRNFNYATYAVHEYLAGVSFRGRSAKKYTPVKVPKMPNAPLKLISFWIPSEYVASQYRTIAETADTPKARASRI